MSHLDTEVHDSNLPSLDYIGHDVLDSVTTDPLHCDETGLGGAHGDPPKVDKETLLDEGSKISTMKFHGETTTADGEMLIRFDVQEVETPGGVEEVFTTDGNEDTQEWTESSFDKFFQVATQRTRLTNQFERIPLIEHENSLGVESLSFASYFSQAGPGTGLHYEDLIFSSLDHLLAFPCVTSRDDIN